MPEPSAVSARIPRPTREESARPAPWQPPSSLPDPNPVPGWVFRWVRLASLGDTDTTGVSKRLREGWVPVSRNEVPEIAGPLAAIEKADEFPDAVIVGGLMLCKIPEEVDMQRREYYSDLASAQLASVNTQNMPIEDSRMPLIKERKTQTSVGGRLRP